MPQGQCGCATGVRANKALQQQSELFLIHRISHNRKLEKPIKGFVVQLVDTLNMGIGRHNKRQSCH